MDHHLLLEHDLRKAAAPLFPDQPSVRGLELLQRFGARDQPLRIGISGHLDQRAVELDAPAAAHPCRLERRDDCAGSTKLVVAWRENAVDNGRMRRIDQAFGDIAEAPRPACFALHALGVAERVRTVDRDDARGAALDDEALPAISELEAVPARSAPRSAARSSDAIRQPTVRRLTAAIAAVCTRPRASSMLGSSAVNPSGVPFSRSRRETSWSSLTT